MGEKLRPKYSVYRLNIREQDTVDTRTFATDPDSIDSPFVLMPRKDPAAFAAMVTYARMCEPDLAREIREFLHKIADAEPIFGTQGLRNLQVVRKRSISDIILS